jgi:hypothetical protein
LTVAGCSGQGTADGGGWCESIDWANSESVWGPVVDQQDKVDRDTAAQDIDASLRDTRVLIELLDDRYEWISSHPPEPCYQVAHMTAIAWLERFRKSQSLAVEALEQRDATQLVQGKHAFVLRSSSPTAGTTPRDAVAPSFR